jgi:hypothetical protein
VVGAPTVLYLIDFAVLGTASSAYDVSIAFGFPFGNGTATAPGDAVNLSFTLILDNPSGGLLSSATEAVVDDNTSYTSSLFANFSLSGLATGDVIHIEGMNGLVGDAGAAYLGGVGFTAVTAPEPSTYALLFAGLGAVIVFARFRKLA